MRLKLLAVMSDLYVKERIDYWITRLNQALDVDGLLIEMAGEACDDPDGVSTHLTGRIEVTFRREETGTDAQSGLLRLGQDGAVIALEYRALKFERLSYINATELEAIGLLAKTIALLSTSQL